MSQLVQKLISSIQHTSRSYVCPCIKAFDQCAFFLLSVEIQADQSHFQEAGVSDKPITETKIHWLEKRSVKLLWIRSEEVKRLASCGRLFKPESKPQCDNFFYTWYFHIKYIYDNQLATYRPYCNRGMKIPPKIKLLFTKTDKEIFLKTVVT